MLVVQGHLGPATVCAASDFLSWEQLTVVEVTWVNFVYLDLLVLHWRSIDHGGAVHTLRQSWKSYYLLCGRGMSCHCSDVNPHNIQGSCRGWIFLARCTSATREIWSSKCPLCTHSLQPLLWCTVLNGIYNHKTVLAVSYRVPVSLGLDFHFLYYTTVMVDCCMETSFCLLCCTAFLWQPSLLHQWQTFLLANTGHRWEPFLLKLSMATVHCFWCLGVNWPISFA